jgi:hypothetical protein
MDLAERLRERRAEIEQAILARVYGVADPTDGGDLEYVAGLRAAVAAAVEYGLDAARERAEPCAAVPPALAAQARYAARSGVGLDTVLRRYFAGYMVLGDYLIQAAREAGPSEADPELRRAWRALAAHFDRTLTAVTDEYTAEAEGRGWDTERRRGARVERLLAGELLEVADLDYELGAWHIGAILSGPGARPLLRDLAAALDRRLLLVHGAADTVWAWLGGQRQIDAAEVLGLAADRRSPEVSLALGEAAEGIAGWRLTHRQAKAAAPIALRDPPAMVRYADVALLASALGDEVLAGSLRESYLTPLECERDGGATLRETLRAYFAAGRNVSSTAAALRASRQTVKNRLSLAEARIGRPLDACAAEMETALGLRELEAGSGQSANPAGQI